MLFIKGLFITLLNIYDFETDKIKYLSLGFGRLKQNEGTKPELSLVIC